MSWTGLALILVVGLGACGSDPVDGYREAAETGQAREANQLVLDSLPDLPGRTLEQYEEVGSPSGGEGLMAELLYRGPATMRPAEIVEFFEESMEGWRPVCRQVRPTRASIDLRHGDAWVAVSAGEYDLSGGSAPGFTVAVNAIDGEIMERDYVSNRTCD